MAKTYEQLLEELDALDKRRDDLRKKMRVEKKRMAAEAKKLEAEACIIFGQVVFKATGLDWHNIDPGSFAELLRNETTIQQITNIRPSSKDTLNELKTFEKDLHLTKTAIPNSKTQESDLMQKEISDDEDPTAHTDKSDNPTNETNVDYQDDNTNYEEHSGSEVRSRFFGRG